MNASSASQSVVSAQLSLKTIEASSVGRVALLRLRRAREGVVQGVFRTAINIQFDRELVSFVAQGVPKGPLNVTLELPFRVPSLFALGAKIGDKVQVHGFALELGDHNIISFRSAGVFSPNQNFKKPVLSRDKVEANIEVARKTALDFGKLTGLGELLSVVTSGMAKDEVDGFNIFSLFALARIARLERAFQSEDEEGFKSTVHELIGLGPGLTPSSDDLLAGLVLVSVLYAKNSKKVVKASKFAAKAIVDQLRGSTTYLSEEYLRQASYGRGSEPAMKLCAAMLTGGPIQVEEATMQVLEMGETSGTDFVLGVVLGSLFCISKPTCLALRSLNEK